MKKIAIGDPVEVKFVDRIEGEFWRPATVCFANHLEIGVVYADHSRQSFTRHMQGLTWRTPR